MRGILNFAHRRIQVPANVALRTVNLSIELESLAFAIKVLNTKSAAKRKPGRLTSVVPRSGTAS
jgi:hypothetical protein